MDQETLQEPLAYIRAFLIVFMTCALAIILLMKDAMKTQEKQHEEFIAVLKSLKM